MKLRQERVDPEVVIKSFRAMAQAAGIPPVLYRNAIQGALFRILSCNADDLL